MKNNFIKKAIAIILMIAILFCSSNPLNSNAQADLTKQFQSGNAVISFTQQGQWDTGYITEITLQNKGEQPIKNWKLEANLKGAIENIWNATREKNNGLTIITNEGWNCNIEAGKSIMFGMKVEGGSFNDIFNVVLKQGKEQAYTDGYGVEYNITQQWEKHAILDVIIHNTGQKKITGWTLAFQLDGTIVNIWNADIQSETNNQYTIISKDYNAIIKPDSSVTFGMEIQYTSNVFQLPENETLKSYEMQEEDKEDNSGSTSDAEEDQQIDWNDKTDTDGDGLPDVLEQNQYYTDIHNKDTDGDGLEDGYEVETGTDPALSDTDEDGLDDGEELNQYKSNPLESDTDKDGLMDGDEIVLRLNPLKPDTDGNGILDGEEYIPQSIDRENIDSDLYEENDAVLSYIKLKAKGNINREADITEYEGCLRHDNPALIGNPVLLKDMEIESGEIQFKLSDEYEIPEYQIDGTYTNGLLICYNDNQEGDTVPLETNYDKKARTLTAKISNNGIYFVLDAVEMFNGLGIDLEQSTAPVTRKVAARSLATAAKAGTNAENAQTETVKGKADIIFAVDTTASMDFYIDNVKYNLSTFVEELSKFNVSASFALVEFKDITVDGKDSTNIKKNGNSVWTSNISKFKKKIGRLEIEGGGDHLETPIDALETARRMKKHESAQKYIILVTDEKYKTDNGYGIKDMDEMIDLLCKDDITVSVVSHEQRRNDYKKLYEKTGGKFAAVSLNFAEQLLGIAAGVIEDTNDGYWIALKGLIPEPVKLEEKPTRNSKVDKDKDGLPDWKELISLTPKSYISTASVLGKLTKTGGAGKKIPVYEYYSHPARKDTENDGIMDKEDNRPKVKGIYSSKEKKVVVGEMTIVSCTNLPFGHSFFVYKSYVKNKLDFKKFTGGYQYKTWEEQKPCEYLIKPSEYVSIGNAGQAADGSGTELRESKDEINDGDKAGVYFNREFAYEHLEGKAKYDKNWAYKREISDGQLKSIIKTFEKKNYYHITANNCTKVAIVAWNKACPDEKFTSVTLPKDLKTQISKMSARFAFNMSKEVPNIR